MATNPVKLIIDRQAKKIYPYPNAAAAIPGMFQSNVVDFEISVIDTPGVSQSSITFADCSAYGMRVSIGDTPTGSSGGPAPLALQTSWTWVAGTYPSGSKFVGSIALNTTSIDTFIGPAASKPAYFEVNLTLAGNRITIFQGQVTLFAVVDEGTSTVPTPTDSYMTKNESIDTFAKKVGDPGVRFVTTSADGNWQREFGVDNNGSPIDNIFHT